MKKLLLFLLLLNSHLCILAQSLSVEKKLVYARMLDCSQTISDNNGNPCAKIIIETSLKNVDIVGGYIINEVSTTNNGYEFYVSVPKKEGQFITLFHDEFNSISIPLWVDSPLKGGAEYVLTLNRGADTSMKSLYAHSNVETVDLSSLKTSIANDMSEMFLGCTNLKKLDLSKFDTSNVRDMNSMFYGCDGLINLDLSSFNTSKVTNMYRMFCECSQLKEINVRSFNTSRVANMSCMFGGCKNLTSLDLSNFNTSNVIDMSAMFNGCERLTSLDLSNFNTSKVTDMSGMFACFMGSNLLSLNLSNFNTSKVINMSSMFCSCEKLSTIDLSSFDTSMVTSMSDMFCQCSSLTSLDLSNFNTSNVTDMSGMFNLCENLEVLDLSNFCINTEETYMMFSRCNRLQTIKVTNCNRQTIEKLKSALRNEGIDKQVRFIY